MSAVLMKPKVRQIASCNHCGTSDDVAEMLVPLTKGHLCNKCVREIGQSLSKIENDVSVRRAQLSRTPQLKALVQTFEKGFEVPLQSSAMQAVLSAANNSEEMIASALNDLKMYLEARIKAADAESRDHKRHSENLNDCIQVLRNEECDLYRRQCVHDDAAGVLDKTIAQATDTLKYL